MMRRKSEMEWKRKSGTSNKEENDEMKEKGKEGEEGDLVKIIKGQ
jgi:hypothetical protein